MSWLTEILLQHEEFESPINFVWWSGVTAISAVVKDNIWVDRHLFKQYPNIFVILYADSGLKKGPPINMARTLVEKVNKLSKPPVTKIISGRSSIQGILSVLSQHQTVPGGHINLNSTGFICASELSSSLVKDEAAFDILTDLYDRSWYEEKYENILKQEQISLTKPTISLLGGINEAHAEALFARKDVQGGYVGRCFIIHESKRSRVNSLIYKPKNPPKLDELAQYLLKLSKLHGPFAPLEGTEAGKTFDEWYNEFVSDIEGTGVKDSTGTLNRFSESVMKVAMLISLAKKPELTIDKDSVLQAIEKCEKIIAGVRKTTSGQGKSRFAYQKTLVIQELLERPGNAITHEQLAKKFYLQATSPEWREIMQTLIEAGIVTINPNIKNAVVYVMPESEVNRIREFMRGKTR